MSQREVLSELFKPCSNETAAADAVLSKLQENVLPHSKMEEWSYTNFAKSFSNFSCAASAPEGFEITAPVSSYGERLTFVNGELIGDSPSSKFVTVYKSGETLPQAYLAELENCPTAMGAVGDYVLHTLVYVDVPAGEKCSLELSRFVCEATTGEGTPVVPTRLFVRAEKGASVQVYEEFKGIGSEEYLSLHAATFVAEDTAKIEHVKIVRECEEASHYSMIWGRCGADAVIKTVAFNVGGGLIRNEIHPTLEGENGEVWLVGANAISKSQQVDNYTVIDHAVPHCESHELYKGMYGGDSKGAFSGTIIVREEAQKTNAYQSNASLLCSDTAESNSKPQLKIWADDVKCSHGATVGQLDDEALFYLRARGIPEAIAKIILTRAYVSEVFSHIEDEGISNHADQLLESKLEELL